MSSSHSWINTILLVDVFVVDDALGRRRRRRRRQTPHILFSIIGGHLHTRATNENLRLVEKSKFPSLSLSTHTNTHTRQKQPTAFARTILRFPVRRECNRQTNADAQSETRKDVCATKRVRADRHFKNVPQRLKTYQNPKPTCTR